MRARAEANWHETLFLPVAVAGARLDPRRVGSPASDLFWRNLLLVDSKLVDSCSFKHEILGAICESCGGGGRGVVGVDEGLRAGGRAVGGAGVKPAAYLPHMMSGKGGGSRDVLCVEADLLCRCGSSTC